MKKILCFICLVTFTFSLDFDKLGLNVELLNNKDYTQAKALLKGLESRAKQRDLSFEDYQKLEALMLCEMSPFEDCVTPGFVTNAAYFFTKFMAKEFGHLFAEYGMGSNMGYENFEYKKEYSLYDEIVFWFPINKNSPSQKEAYENFLFMKKHFKIATEIDDNGKRKKICRYGDAGGGECMFIPKKPLVLRGVLKAIQDFHLQPARLGSCDDGSSPYNAFEPHNKNLVFAFGEVDLTYNQTYYNLFAPLLPEWYKEGLGGSVNFEVELELESVMPWKFSACAAGNSIQIKNIKILKKISENPSQKKDYEDNEYYKVTLNTSDNYVNLRNKPNGKILAQIFTKDKENIKLINLSNMLWSLNKISEWQRQIGYKQKLDFEDKQKLGQEWVKYCISHPMCKRLKMQKLAISINHRLK
ncbi:hypothetical protein [Helicobacter sp. UBA3407]|uniref:hypothetical protein n=1 Tax=Helicobacter sp. UBA3407 TaxID=1946588 RepID=UPI002629F862|nr:hypothetical protein [Helicobacter sp. UBA3407]